MVKPLGGLVLIIHPLNIFLINLVNGEIEPNYGNYSA